MPDDRSRRRAVAGSWVAFVIGALAVSSGALAAAPPPAAPASTPTATVPAPPSGLAVTDLPNDAGRELDLVWKASPDDVHGGTAVGQYLIERAPAPGGPWTVVDSVGAGTTTFSDQGVHRGTEYFYRVTAAGPGGLAPAGSVTGPIRATSQWINTTRWSVLLFTAMFFAFVLFFMWQAQSGKKPFVRRIPGVDAIEEAIGRATEMGRPVLYIPGIQDIDDIQTVAGLVILESVARSRPSTRRRFPCR